MTLSVEQTAELAKPVARTVYFVEFQFRGSTARLSTANFEISAMGWIWSGVGAIGSIGSVEESDGMESRPLNFSINAAQPSLLALAVGDVEAYRGRPAKMWMCPLDENWRLVGVPERCWSGTMDLITVDIGEPEGRINLKCETSAYGLKRRPALRLNAAQQKKKYPSDTGLDYLTDLIANPQVWLSRRFQQV